MAKPERRQADDDQPTLAGGGAGLRTPGAGSSSDGRSPADAPTLVPLSKTGSDSPVTERTTPPPRATASDTPYGTTPILQPQTVLGKRYQILELLGQGGMGAVYKAKDRELNRLVALKVIRPDLAGNYAIIERFKQELILAHQVTHRNVIRIYDLAEGDGLKFITMEFIEGEDLRSMIHERQKLPPEEAVEIMRQVCRALEAAHMVGVIHRDLKPQNIMRDKAGRVLVMDFGLARTLEGSGMTQTGALVGTMEYMSPEQALGKDLDQRSDLFAAGLILYELLTGKMPFTADSALASLIKRTQERAAPVSDHDRAIPGALSGIVSKCLERDLNLRYQNASEILVDLEAWQGKRAAATLGFHHVKPWGQTVPWPLLGAIFVALILAVTGFVFRHRLFEGPAKQAAVQGPITSLAILPFRNASGDASLDWLGPSLAEMLSTDVGQSSQLRTVSPDRLHQVLADLRVSANASLEPGMLQRVAEFSSADTLVWGQYAKFGDQIRIDATLQDLKHDRRVPLKIDSASDKDIPGAVDRLAESIRQNLSVPPDVLKELKVRSFQPTSKSVVALREYNQGVQLLRGSKNLDALKAFQLATKEDNSFALAFSKLAETYARLGYDGDAEQASRTAVDLSHNLPAPAQYLIAANHARIIKDYPKAIQSYEELAKVAVDDSDVQFTLASLYEDTGAFDKAHEHFDKVLHSDPKNVDTLLAIGRVELRQGNPQSGLEYLNRALSLAIQLGNDEEEAAVLHVIGACYLDMNRPDEALRNYQQSLEIKRRLGQRRGIADSLHAIAQVHDSAGKPDLALKGYRDALQIYREIGDKAGVGGVLNDLGDFYNDRGKYDQALKLFKESLQIQREVGNENYQAFCLSNIGNAYLFKGDYDNARIYFEQALQIREKIKVPVDTALVIHNLAEVSTKTGQYDLALKQYLRAIELRRAAGDRLWAAIESYSMGTVFEYQGRFGASVESKQEALETLQELKDRSYWLAEIMSSYGHALAQAGRAEEARKTLAEGLNLARQSNNQGIVAEALNFQANSLLYTGNLRAAKPVFEQALQAASRTSDRQQVLLSKINLAKLAITAGHSPAVIHSLQSLAEEADALGLKYESMECSLSQAQALIDNKDFSQARQLLERALDRSEKLGLALPLIKAHYLLGTELRLSGSAPEAATHYNQVLHGLDQLRQQPGNDKVLQREDLKTIYSESSRWSHSANN